MKTLKQIGRVLLIIIAVLVLVISLGGIIGSWWANSVASDVTNRVFSVVNGGITLAETGVQQADQMVGDGRAEVKNASDTVVAVGQNLEENSPVLTALNERVETRLAPTVELISTTLEPAVNALNTVDQVLGVMNAIPFIQQDAPKLAKLRRGRQRPDATDRRRQAVGDDAAGDSGQREERTHQRGGHGCHRHRDPHRHPAGGPGRSSPGRSDRDRRPEGS